MLLELVPSFRSRSASADIDLAESAAPSMRAAIREVRALRGGRSHPPGVSPG